LSLHVPCAVPELHLTLHQRNVALLPTQFKLRLLKVAALGDLDVRANNQVRRVSREYPSICADYTGLHSIHIGVSEFVDRMKAVREAVSEVRFTTT
jgi:hypothetical protein